MWRFVLLCLTIYLSGVVLYSALFVFSANQDPVAQTAKIFVAGAHILVLFVPVVLAQSRSFVLRALGFILIAGFFIYAVFLVGYFPYFGFVPELYAFDLRNAQDLGEVSDHYFGQLFGWREISLVALFALLIWQVLNTPIPKLGTAILVVPALLFVISLHSFGGPSGSEKFGNVTVLRRFGPVVFSYVSLTEWLRLGGGYLEEPSDYPGKIAQFVKEPGPPKKAFISEIPKVSRVTILQIESFDTTAIDARLSDIPTMPFVSSLRERCLNYQNFFTMKGAGGSSDAEFSIATGLIPSTRLPSLKHFDFSRVDTLYEVLASHEIRSTFAHNNQRGFYGRGGAYEQIAALETRFLDPLDRAEEVDFARDWLSNSLLTSEKSLHYFFNFQSHGPYQGYSVATAENFSISRGQDIRVDYLATMSEVDRMIEALFDLQASGFERGENLFIVMADHPSYLHATDDELSRYRIPLMICHGDFEGVEIPNVFGSIDLFPTILEAFGVPPRQPVLGQSMFWETRNAVLLPTRDIIRRNSQGTPEIIPCDADCDEYFKFTEQHLKF
ncbi:LTA synthase family protein [Silicimonas sp. MF1-12-2]|uniref:LTA synthase family protein n=1 Tax=Silicimonas sp. MF1-12-2 TaxID=3384793 RepID=UPI0039B62995